METQVIERQLGRAYQAIQGYLEAGNASQHGAECARWLREIGKFSLGLESSQDLGDRLVPIVQVRRQDLDDLVQTYQIITGAFKESLNRYNQAGSSVLTETLTLEDVHYILIEALESSSTSRHIAKYFSDNISIQAD